MKGVLCAPFWGSIRPGHTATSQVGDDRAANADVCRGGVVVQLLVPLLVVGAVDFLSAGLGLQAGLRLNVLVPCCGVSELLMK